jgi:hypothetical protein
LILDDHNSHRTARDALRNSANLKSKIASHQSSSPSHSYDLVDSQAKGISKLAHKVVLLEAEVKTLRTANETLSKRRRAKKIRVRVGRTLNVSGATALHSSRVEVHVEQTNMSENGARTEEVGLRVRRCGKCNNPGHNARTCTVESLASNNSNNI